MGLLIQRKWLLTINNSYLKIIKEQSLFFALFLFLEIIIMKFYCLILSFVLISLTVFPQNNLELAGVLDLDVPTGGSTGKTIHVRALQNISDLSIYGIGIANNGGGTDDQNMHASII